MLAKIFLLVVASRNVVGTSIDELNDEVDDLEQIVNAYVRKRDSQPLLHLYNGYESGKAKLIPISQLNLKMKDAPQLNDEHIVDNCTLDYNGCGGEGTPQALVNVVPFHTTLVGACNKHDMCYGCGKMYGWPQKDCDDAFERDEVALCREKYKGYIHYIQKEECILMAEAYWLGVRTVGNTFYSDESKDYCKQPCAKEFANPERELVDKQDDQPLVQPYNGYESGKPKIVPMDQLKLKEKDAPQLKDEQIVDGCTLDYNGCGGTGTPQEMMDRVPYHDTLVNACNKHDMCYGCGKMYGWSQKDCDEAFLRNEKELCESKYGLRMMEERVKCKAAAETYYKGVRTAGSIFYTRKPKDYCKQPCAKEFANPEREL